MADLAERQKTRVEEMAVEEFKVPCSVISLVKGDRDVNIREARKIDGIVKISLNNLASLNNENLVRIEIIAKSIEAAKKARSMLEFTEIVYSVPSSVFGKCNSKKQELIEEILGKSGVKWMKIEDDLKNEVRFIFNGTVDSIMRAKPILEDRMRQLKMTNPLEIKHRCYGIIADFKLSPRDNQYQAFIKCDPEDVVKLGDQVFVPAGGDHKNRPLVPTYQKWDLVSFFPERGPYPVRKCNYFARKITKMEIDGTPEPFRKDVNGVILFDSDWYGFVQFKLDLTGEDKVKAYFQKCDVGSRFGGKKLELYPVGSRVDFDLHMQPPRNNCEYRAMNIKLVALPMDRNAESLHVSSEVDLEKFDRMNLQHQSRSFSPNSLDFMGDVSDHGDFREPFLQQQADVKPKSFSSFNTLQLARPINQETESSIFVMKGTESGISSRGGFITRSSLARLPQRGGTGFLQGRGRGRRFDSFPNSTNFTTPTAPPENLNPPFGGGRGGCGFGELKKGFSNSYPDRSSSSGFGTSGRGDFTKNPRSRARGGGFRGSIRAYLHCSVDGAAATSHSLSSSKFTTGSENETPRSGGFGTSESFANGSESRSTTQGFGSGGGFGGSKRYCADFYEDQKLAKAAKEEALPKQDELISLSKDEPDQLPSVQGCGFGVKYCLDSVKAGKLAGKKADTPLTNTSTESSFTTCANSVSPVVNANKLHQQANIATVIRKEAECQTDRIQVQVMEEFRKILLTDDSIMSKVLQKFPNQFKIIIAKN